MKVLVFFGVAVLALTLSATAQTKEEAANLYNVGFAAFNTNKYSVAITNFDQALDIVIKIGDEANDIRDNIIKLLPSCHYQLATALNKNKKFVEAIAMFNKTAEVARKFNDQSMVSKALDNIPPLYRILGNQEYVAKNYEKAKQYYNLGLKLNPDATQTILELGLVYNKQAKQDSALICFDKVIEVGTRINKPDDVMKAKNQARDLFLLKASNAEKAGMYEDAITEYQNALKYAPDNEAVYYKMAFANYNLARWADAEKAANKSLEYTLNLPEKAKVYFLLAGIAEAMRDIPNACVNYKNAVRNPKYKAQATARMVALKCQ